MSSQLSRLAEPPARLLIKSENFYVIEIKKKIKYYNKSVIKKNWWGGGESRSQQPNRFYMVGGGLVGSYSFSFKLYITTHFEIH